MHPRPVHTISLHEQPEAWELLFSRSANACVFCSISWLTLLADVFGRDAGAVMLGRAGSPAAGIPLVTRRRGPLRLAAPLPITMYAGILRGSEPSADLESLLPAVERRMHFVSLSAEWTKEELQVFARRGWDLRRQFTYRLDIQDMPRVWEGYSQSLRRKLRRVPDGGFRLDTDPPASVIVRMFEQSYSRHGVRPPFSGEIVDRWLSALRRQGIARCFAARHPDGRPAAVRVVLRDGNVLYDWLAGSDPSVAPSASHWLVHTILERFSAEGCAVFDFMGANTPGVSDFKRGFGGRMTEYHEAEWFRPSLLRHLTAVRNRGRRLRRGM